MMDNLRKYWLYWGMLLGIIGSLMAFSTNIQAMWNSPKRISQAEQSVSELSNNLNTYVVQQQANEQRQDQLIDLLSGFVIHRAPEEGPRAT